MSAAVVLQFPTVWGQLSTDTKEEHPELEGCASATEASRVLFGVKTMTHLLGMHVNMRRDLLAFFAGNQSDMVAWAGCIKAKDVRGLYLSSFEPSPEHRKAYKALVKRFGLTLAARLTLSRDFADTVRGLAFVDADKARKARFETDIALAFSRFPAPMHGRMIHDLCSDAMASAERSAARVARPAAEPTLPAFDSIPDTVQVGGETFKVLVPRTAGDLRRIGNAQNHCVGRAAMGYGDRIKAGRICIFAVYQKSLKDGICVELNLQWGGMTRHNIEQAQGRLHRNPTTLEHHVILDVIDALNNGTAPTTCDTCGAYTDGLETVTGDDETLCEDCAE